jgi:hypothetical protein
MKAQCPAVHARNRELLTCKLPLEEALADVHGETYRSLVGLPAKPAEEPAPRPMCPLVAAGMHPEAPITQVSSGGFRCSACGMQWSNGKALDKALDISGANAPLTRSRL